MAAPTNPSAQASAAPRPLRADAEVVALRAEGGANRRLTLRLDPWPGFEPGQFAMLSPGPRAAVPRDDPLLPRPMAVYRATRAGGTAADVEILFKVEGRGTALLADSRPGQRVGFVGPLGRPFPEPAPGESALVVAGGTGIASVRELAVRLGAKADTAVLLGAQSAEELMGAQDFASPGVRLRIATEDGSEGERGRVTDLLEAELDDRPGRVYACGPTPMMRRCAEIAAERGVACIASLENPMACGFGVCLGCAAPLRAGGFALVCRDGPPMDAHAIAWEWMP